MKRLALCVGINDYPGTGSDLSGCVNDAWDWSSALQERGFVTQVVLDGRATREVVLGRLRTLVAALRYRDRFVFTYSGHGSWIPGNEADGRDEVLVMSDLEYIVDNELHEVFSKVPFGAQATIVSDSCHSGSVHRFLNPHRRDDHPKAPRFLAPEHILVGAELARARQVEQIPARGSSRPGPVLLSGCDDHEFSYDAWFNGRANGALTWHALEALKKDPRTMTEWHDQVRAWLPTDRYAQSPQLQGSRWQRRRRPLG